MPPKKAKPKGKQEPIDYDEALDAGVHQEEQAERYQFGDKALRYYHESLRLYRLAQTFRFTGDAIYNEARVLLKLGDTFTPFPHCRELVSQAIDRFDAARQYEVSRDDACFNMTAALTTRYEMDTDFAGNEPIALDDPQRALSLLDELLVSQISRLQPASQDDDVPDASLGMVEDNDIQITEIVTLDIVLTTIIAKSDVECLLPNQHVLQPLSASVDLATLSHRQEDIRVAELGRLAHNISLFTDAQLVSILDELVNDLAVDLPASGLTSLAEFFVLVVEEQRLDRAKWSTLLQLAQNAFGRALAKLQGAMPLKPPLQTHERKLALADCHLSLANVDRLQTGTSRGLAVQSADREHRMAASGATDANS
ncbi:uncharacterized protein L969DRAFT_96007 [Mixia osmundae IAM 14324]|uniref:Uncharacterized protein n=1 Tax=Mixia osmundae (strain CBS 9802 / IAM 14324 / JCM 22182 / KY 12970) TaxID=764103 RepID=G7DWR7_MIXOS|nr:uncharacterized protein L969DRAFT_55591 [Mixia osmundae IAM 14324]XP_014566734.1 uncharacterized protein L969DRAFT_96007 [Mixia osmundae IAM 14324]KEI36208.1 hypothetical protein L969DRAFT_55591 [Mixia osmundae IAM 14324]KEI38176.1 hypothetical protein L969DRAFT_96007 [Mixia osmundae IAM 14324]GAA95014.1 hypothetical protein E5Q_01669 [Mixia osmundae IAM 14324]